MFRLDLFHQNSFIGLEQLKLPRPNSRALDFLPHLRLKPLGPIGFTASFAPRRLTLPSTSVHSNTT